MTGFDTDAGWSVLMAAALRGDLPCLALGATPASVAASGPAGFVYLATPYSREVRDSRGNWSWHLSAEAMERASIHAALLAQAGVTAVAPVVMSADICHTNRTFDPTDAVFWQRWCAPILAAASAVVVPDLPGWHRSSGIWHEVCVAMERRIPVHVYAEAW